MIVRNSIKLTKSLTKIQRVEIQRVPLWWRLIIIGIDIERSQGIRPQHRFNRFGAKIEVPLPRMCCLRQRRLRRGRARVNDPRASRAREGCARRQPRPPLFIILCATRSAPTTRRREAAAARHGRAEAAFLAVGAAAHWAAKITRTPDLLTSTLQSHFKINYFKLTLTKARGEDLV